MTPDAWQLRHESYVDQNVVDIWFLGHIGSQLRAQTRGGSRVYLTPVQQLMAEQGLPLLWFNPVLLRVGTLDPATLRADRRSEHPRISAELRTWPLAGFSLHPVDGLVHPQLDGVHQAVSDYVRDQALAAERDRQAAQKRAEEAAGRETERLARVARVAMIDAAWSAGSEARALLSRFGGNWPSWLGANVGTENGIPPRIWQAYVLTRVLDEATEGQILGVASVAGRVAAEFGISFQTAQLMVHQWFSVLVVHGVIRKRLIGTKRSPSIEFHMPVNPLVKPRLSTPHDRPGVSRARLLELRSRSRAERDPRTGPDGAVPKPSRQQPADRPTPQEKPKCSRCGYPLDSMWAVQGFHGMCATPRRRYK